MHARKICKTNQLSKPSILACFIHTNNESHHMLHNHLIHYLILCILSCNYHSIQSCLAFYAVFKSFCTLSLYFYFISVRYGHKSKARSQTASQEEGGATWSYRGLDRRAPISIQFVWYGSHGKNWPARTKICNAESRLWEQKSNYLQHDRRPWKSGKISRFLRVSWRHYLSLGWQVVPRTKNIIQNGINKIFDLFDDDHTGLINSNNIRRVAKELGETMNIQ